MGGATSVVGAAEVRTSSAWMARVANEGAAGGGVAIAAAG